MKAFCLLKQKSVLVGIRVQPEMRRDQNKKKQKGMEHNTKPNSPNSNILDLDMHLYQII